MKITLKMVNCIISDSVCGEWLKKCVWRMVRKLVKFYDVY